MSDPFRSLDQIDPPDQWDDIVDRASHDTEVRLLDESPRRSALSRPRTWVAAAAVLALVGGGIALAAGDDPDGVRIDPAESTSASQPVAEGCAFSWEPGGLFPELQPGRQGVEPELGILPGTVAPSFAHGQVGDVVVEVAVGTGLATASAPDPGAYRTGQEGGTGFVEVAGLKDSGVAPPCDQVAVAVRAPVTPQEIEALDAGGPLPTDLAETLAVVLAGTDAVPDEDPLPVGDDQHFDGPCPFTVPGGSRPSLEPGRYPVEPELGILPGPIEPTFAHGRDDELLVELAVGTGLETAAAADGDSLRSGIEGDTGWVEVSYVDATSPEGPCDQTVLVVRVPMLPEDVASGGQDLDVLTYTELTDSVSGLLTAVTLDADGGSSTKTGGSDPRGGPVEGTLADGSAYRVWDDPGHGLCASLGEVDLGCDDVGPVIAPDADPSTPRLGIDECCAPLWFGYLPAGATSVVLDDAQGRRLDVSGEISGAVWALPVPDGHWVEAFDATDTVVIYVMSDGSEVPAPTAG